MRSNWYEVSELIASSLLHTVQKYGSDRIFSFSVIPAMSMLSYAACIAASVAPDYAESTTVADTWINLKIGSDGAFAMAMGHVILIEYYVKQQTPFFIDYAKRFTDFPLIARRNGISSSRTATAASRSIRDCLCSTCAAA